MNKIKLMLTAVVVLSAVGGALAFKAKKFVHTNQTLYTTNGSGTNCNVSATTFTTTTDVLANKIKASTASGTNNCIDFYTTDQEQ